MMRAARHTAQSTTTKNDYLASSSQNSNEWINAKIVLIFVCLSRGSLFGNRLVLMFLPFVSIVVSLPIHFPAVDVYCFNCSVEWSLGRFFTSNNASILYGNWRTFLTHWLNNLIFLMFTLSQSVAIFSRSKWNGISKNFLLAFVCCNN